SIACHFPRVGVFVSQLPRVAPGELDTESPELEQVGSHCRTLGGRILLRPRELGTFLPRVRLEWTGRVINAAGLALIPVMFTCSGWNAAAYIASEVRNPETTLPRSLALGTLITIVAYLALNILYLYALPVTALSGVVRVGEQTTSVLFGSRAAQAISALIA